MQKTGKEIPLEYFIDEKHYPLSTDDEYPGTGHGISRHNLRADSNLLQRFPCCCHVPVAREETENDLPVFLRSTHRKKSADITDDPELQQATISDVPCGSYNGKWRELPMRNDGLLPYVYTSWVFGRVFSGR